MGAQLGVSVLVLFCTIAPSPGQAYIYAVSVCFHWFSRRFYGIVHLLSIWLHQIYTLYLSTVNVHFIM